MRMPPVTIEVLLGCYYRGQTPSLDSPARRAAFTRLVNEGLVLPMSAEVTERGRAHVEAICNLPLPVAVWVTPKESE